MTVRILTGDCRDVLRTLPDVSVNCVVTSPPYFGLRDYGVAGQIGLEPSPDAFVAELVAVFRECRRVLKDDGTLWLNLGDSYATSGGSNTTPHMGAMFADRARGQEVISRGKRLPRGEGRWGGGNNKAAGLLKPKDLIGIPWRAAFALQADGWWLRQDIIWAKPNPMPESVTDRCTKAHEYLFLLSKSARYYYDAEAISEIQSSNGNGGFSNKETLKSVRLDASHKPSLSNAENDGLRNRRSVWTVATAPFADAHFATFPPDLIEPCIKAGCPKDGTVLDPFGGAGTTGLVADRLGRNAILIELNPTYSLMAANRIKQDSGMFSRVEIVPDGERCTSTPRASDTTDTLPCVKATSPAYWALVRKHFPETFDRMAVLSRELDVRLCRIKNERRFIDEIPADYETTNAVVPACDFLCALAEADMAAA